MVGQTVGKYRIVDRLGRGGMGTVYRAVDETLHREVAIKVLNTELNDPGVGRRFRAEAVAIARLNHPGIAMIYELVQHDGQWLMVIEFVRGETLEALVARSGPLSANHAAELSVQVLSALAHAHSMGVIHRDLKPANIMCSDMGTTKIMDFGIARVAGTEHLTSAGFLMGTPAYMAPEQVKGGEIDSRTDLYSAGVVLYFLATARLPFKGDTPMAMAQSRMTDLPTPIRAVRPDLPAWLSQITERALERALDRRYQTADEMREALRRSLSGLPVTVAPLATTPPELVATSMMNVASAIPIPPAPEVFDGAAPTAAWKAPAATAAPAAGGSGTLAQSAGPAQAPGGPVSGPTAVDSVTASPAPAGPATSPATPASPPTSAPPAATATSPAASAPPAATATARAAAAPPAATAAARAATAPPAATAATPAATAPPAATVTARAATAPPAATAAARAATAPPAATAATPAATAPPAATATPPAAPPPTEATAATRTPTRATATAVTAPTLSAPTRAAAGGSLPVPKTKTGLGAPALIAIAAAVVIVVLVAGLWVIRSMRPAAQQPPPAAPQSESRPTATEPAPPPITSPTGAAGAAPAAPPAPTAGATPDPPGGSTSSGAPPAGRGGAVAAPPGSPDAQPTGTKAGTTVPPGTPPPGTIPAGVPPTEGASTGAATPAASGASPAGPGRTGSRGSRGTPTDTVLRIDNIKDLVVSGRSGTERDVLLYFGGGQLSVVAQNGSPISSFQYPDLLIVNYIKARDPKWDESQQPGPPLNLDVPGGMFRSAKHWLVIQARTGYVVLRLEDANWKSVVDTIEARTGRKVFQPSR